MRILKRLFGALFFLIGLIGLVLCVAGVIGCWRAYDDLLKRSGPIFDKGEKALTKAREDLVAAREPLTKARERLKEIQEREAAFAASSESDNGRQRRLQLRSLVRDAPPQLREARGMIINTTEAAVVVNGLLDAAADLPGVERSGLDTAKLEDASKQLSEATQKADKLAERLGGTDDPLSPQELENSKRIAEILDRIIEVIDDGINWTDRTLTKVKDWHARFPHILLLSAVVITIALIWIALGQFSLMAHGFSWALGRRTPAKADGTVPT
jgi:hypothetical protein